MSAKDKPSFLDYFSEVRTQVHDPKKYSLVVDVLKGAKSAYHKGGFSDVVDYLVSYRENNKWRIHARAIVLECDNWRYAIQDLETAIHIAERYRDKLE